MTHLTLRDFSVLPPVFSRHMGDMGPETFRFAEFLAEATYRHLGYTALEHDDSPLQRRFADGGQLHS
jgi:hypothetical protein